MLGLDQLQCTQDPPRGRIMELDTERDAEINPAMGQKPFDCKLPSVIIRNHLPMMTIVGARRAGLF